MGKPSMAAFAYNDVPFSAPGIESNGPEKAVGHLSNLSSAIRSDL
jgi:hypothetical protein